MTAGRSMPSYVVVENSGMTGECDVGRFGTHGAALGWIERTYTAAERDPTSDRCLYPDVCVEVDGSRSYEL